MPVSQLNRRSGANPRVLAVVQSRMGSTRLPGKAMLDLAGRPLTWHVLQRAAAIRGVDDVVMATGVGKENQPLIELAESMGCLVFAGSPDNVLERYYQAAQRHSGDVIIRITGDNPFTDPAYAAQALELLLDSGADLCSLSGLPLGCAVEVVTFAALDRCMKEADKPHHFEHVTPYIKENPGTFRVERRASSFQSPFEHLRLTVDTDEDFRLVSLLYSELYSGKIISLPAVVEYLVRHPGLLDINRHVEQRPMTHHSSHA